MTTSRPGPNSAFWNEVRDLEDLMALSQDLEEWSMALLELLRQNAGASWTQYALEKAIIVRRMSKEIAARLRAIHPRPWGEE